MYKTKSAVFSVAKCGTMRSFIPALILIGVLWTSVAHGQNMERYVATSGVVDSSLHAVATNQPMVDDYKVTILDDMIPGRRTLSEWGFSALIEIKSGGLTKRFLFDTGGQAQTVLTNAQTLNINLCDIQDVIVSHNHQDHTAGLSALRTACKGTNPSAFLNAYAGGNEIFYPRISAGTNANTFIAERDLYLAQGGNFIINSQPTAQFLGLPGVWLTGKITRKHDEKTYPGTPNIQNPDGTLSSDVMPEETALVINTATGMVVITGCAHAGAINTIETAQAILGAQPPITLVGGIHALSLPLGDESTNGTEGTFVWEARQMLNNGVNRILGAHCTGVERLLYARTFLGLDDSSVVLSSVGTELSLSGGFGYTLPFAVNLPLRCPLISAITNGSYGSKISAGDTVVVWGASFTAGGSKLLWTPASGGGQSVVLSDTTGRYFWDQSKNQINATLPPAITSGAWYVQVQGSCLAPSARWAVTVN
jgi:7,8-dihydropterin-6-yl-methyl-4-(beta-D-ribofuranosyl)aminobenzene 5'-phosphate synthase